MPSSLPADAVSSGLWLRSRPFDLFFIFGIAGLTLLCGFVISNDDHYITTIASLNVLLLATPHFISTYTRIAFDRKSARKYLFLIFPLPLLVLSVVALMAFSAGGWFITAVYLYWQWWHFARQNYGISRIYLSKAASVYTPHPFWDNYALYALPLCGILYRSYQQPHGYLGREIRTIPVPLELVYAMGAVAAVLLVMQAIHWWKAHRQRTLPVPYFLYVLSHYGVFLTCYLLIPNISYGWLAFNIWHNMQYISFVWLYNNQRLKSGQIPDRTMLADCSKGKTLWIYLLIIIAMAGILNFMVGLTSTQASKVYAVLPWALIVSMSVSFHHYIVDAIVWKRKRRAVYA